MIRKAIVALLLCTSVSFSAPIPTAGEARKNAAKYALELCGDKITEAIKLGKKEVSFLQVWDDDVTDAVTDTLLRQHYEVTCQKGVPPNKITISWER